VRVGRQSDRLGGSNNSNSGSGSSIISIAIIGPRQCLWAVRRLDPEPPEWIWACVPRTAATKMA
jgi:hypothetical protein